MTSKLKFFLFFSLIIIIFQNISAAQICKNNNGIVTNIWIESSKINNIKNNNIKYLFVDLGDTGKNGKITTNHAEIKRFLRMIKIYERKNNYNFILLAYSEVNSDVYNVNDQFLRNYVNDYKQITSFGFDGVLVDIEPVRLSLRPKYIEMLKNLNKKLPNKIISVYSGSMTEDINNEWEWSKAFYQNVSPYADILSVQGFDLGEPNKESYINYLTSQIKLFSAANFSSCLLLTVPTHHIEPEIIENAIQAYSETKSKNENKFNGINIFAEWTTDKNEWDLIKNFTSK